MKRRLANTIAKKLYEVKLLVQTQVMGSAEIPYGFANDATVQIPVIESFLEMKPDWLVINETNDPKVFRVSYWIESVEFYVLVGSEIIQNYALRGLEKKSFHTKGDHS